MYTFSEQLKSRKHSEYKNVYVVDAYEKTFHVQHFLNEHCEHKGEWVILEINGEKEEWVDTVCGKAVALIRIRQLYGEKEKRTKMVMDIDYLYGRVNELFELYDEGEMNEIKAHKLFRECCENFLGGKNGRD